MSDKQLSNDASASSKGQIYQLYMALKKCFEMTMGQKIYIERYGDVTLGNSAQIEVKHYKNPLTDNDANFWNTLKNWLADDFNDSFYSALILCTTQQIGEHSKFKEWNDADVKRRIAILEDISIEAEQRELKKQQSKLSQSIPESLKLQRMVLDKSKRDKLCSIVEKFVIDYDSPSLSQLYTEIKDIHCKGILNSKRNDFVNALLGYLISPATVGKMKWDIAYEDFDSKVGDLKSLYCRDTKIFPQKFYTGDVCLNSSDVDSCKDHDFVNKIRDIDYHEVVTDAIREYLQASRTILEEFRDYNVAEWRYKAYEEEIGAGFTPKYRSARRNVSDAIKDSQDFYDAIISEESPELNGFDRPPRIFKNGVLHMLMNDLNKALKWRLEES